VFLTFLCHASGHIYKEDAPDLSQNHHHSGIVMIVVIDMVLVRTFGFTVLRHRFHFGRTIVRIVPLVRANFC